ncbi:photoreceptor outer segment membrane glycoprotein 2-like [Corythoichthys intestinalis]|uniref:photoreceptor outer segment membrane glycoprotein 2-like n=1 Tax=Corythoichthys intestinalis TaxID=161448 RepID=UPI0025A540AA|nr:photoreceptor outer segment membrane glycoprotein 2-like [Corythoichthys intestinalis]XP_061798789.1 photoreceptor outer segment membrane glycoprotein 2-like [Nerophis lumbriciformis]
MAVLKVTFTKTKRDKLAQVLWILNWISVVTGVILFSLGLFLKVELNKRWEMMADTDIQYVPNMLISVGLIACAINFLGGKICYDCADTAKFLRWKLIMLPYIVCTFFFTFCVLVGALMCYTMHWELDESLREGLTKAMKYYKDTDTPGRCFLKRAVDTLQIEFQCCGNKAYTDWFRIQWISNRYLDMAHREVVDRLRSNVEGKYLMDAVPFSCCNVNSPRPCIQQQVSNNSAHFNYDHRTEQLNLWTKGCHQALLDYYTGIVHSIGLTVLITWLFELSVLTGVRYLQTSLENMLRLGDPDCESEGWLLENSFIETARSNLNIIKTLSKNNHVDTGSNGDPNINVPSTSKAHYGPDNVPPQPKPAAS